MESLCHSKWEAYHTVTTTNLFPENRLSLPTIATLLPVIPPLSWENESYLSGFIKHNKSQQTSGKVLSAVLSWAFQQKYQCPSGEGRGDWARVFYNKTNAALKPNHVCPSYPGHTANPCPSCTESLCGVGACHTSYRKSGGF